MIAEASDKPPVVGAVDAWIGAVSMDCRHLAANPKRTWVKREQASALCRPQNLVWMIVQWVKRTPSANCGIGLQFGVVRRVLLRHTAKTQLATKLSSSRVRRLARCIGGVVDAVIDDVGSDASRYGLIAALLESSADCIKLLDLAGRLVSMNGPGLCAMEIDDFAPLLGKPWPSLWPVEDQCKAKAAIETALAGRVARFSASCPTAKGTKKWWDVTVVPVTGQDGSVEKLLATSRDITALREAEAQVQQQLLHQEALQYNPNMFWVADPDGKIVQVNNARLQFMGRDAAEATGSGWIRYIHPDDRERYNESAREAARTRCALDITFRLLAASGDHRWVRSRAYPKVEGGRIVRWYGYSEDIHDQKLALDALSERERELRDSEDRYRLAAQATRDSIWEWDLRTDRVTRAQSEAEAYGYPIDQISNTGKWWKDHLHPDDQAATLAELEAALASTSDVWTAQYRFLRADGGYGIAADRAFIVRSADGTALRLIGATRDITDEVRVNAALARSEEHHRYTVELAPQIPFVMDPEANLTEISSRWTELTGQPVEAALGKGWIAVTHPDDADAVRQAAHRSVTTGEPYDQRSRKRTADGSYRWLRVRAYPRRDDMGRIVCWYGYGEDVDDAVRSEQALRQSEERLRLVTSAAGIGIYDCDADGTALCSPLYCDLYGLPRETAYLSYREWLAMVHPDDRERVNRATWDAIKAGTRVDYEFRIIRADTGEVRWLDSRGKARVSEKGRILRSYGAQWDVTERKRAERELERLQDQALQASRLNAMGAMASTLAHELNQPLAAISNYLAAACISAERSGADDKFFGHALSAAGKEAIRAGDIVRKLRAFVSKGTVSRQRVVCEDVITNAGRLVANGRAPIPLTISIAPDAQAASADPVQVEQVLCNLLRNAKEAVGEQSRPKIAVSATRESPGLVRIAVEDNGPGVNSEAARNLFSPFASTKEDGMGVGLSICRTIIEAHGGRIWHEARPGGGAVFAFTLPADE